MSSVIETEIFAAKLRRALQWGHGAEAVEMTRRRPSRRAQASSFNGATALRPWRYTLFPDAKKRGVAQASARGRRKGVGLCCMRRPLRVPC